MTRRWKTIARPPAAAVGMMILAAIMVAGTAAFATDWPTWRGDAMRSAVASEALPEQLHLQWVREFPALEPAWLDEPRMRFDAAYEPILAGGLLFIASPRADRISAFDAATGEHRWDFFADGPIRFAPTVWRDRVFFGSDDGHLYCVNAGDGGLRWRFRGGPSDRLVLGNGRLISTWPVRGAPVVADGTVYFAAGIWPFMGVFIYALDAETGEVVWVNDGQGAEFTAQPQGGAYAFGSVAPQGYLAVSGDALIVPNGRATPAVFDRETGAMRFFHHQENDKIGDFAVSATAEMYFNSGHAYPVQTGTPPGPIGAMPVHTAGAVYTVENGTVVAYGATGAAPAEYHGSRGRQMRLALAPLWRSEVVTGRIHAMAGDTLLTADGGSIGALGLSDGAPWVSEVWSEQLPDEVASMSVAGGRLFVSTLTGRVLCYGPDEVQARRYALEAPAPLPQGPRADRVREMLELTGTLDGYALCLGVEDGELIEEMVRQSNLHLIGIDPDGEKIDHLRRRFDALGLYGPRVALIAADPADLRLPAWVASVIFSEDATNLLDEPELAERLLHSMRPYGGAAVLEVAEDEHTRFAALVTQAGLAGAEVERAGNLTLLRRPGALPGAGSWTHQFGDSANSVVSPDSIVRAPLGLLWFGGSTNMEILERYGLGSPQRVIEGRLFIEGPGYIRAQDVYTGQVLWERELPGFGRAYDSAAQRPGANPLDSNFSVARDGVYVVVEGRCLRLDPATGETISEFNLQAAPGEEQPYGFGFVSVYLDLLIMGASPLIVEEDEPIGTPEDWDATSSARIMALDRYSGEILWSHDSETAFRHNTICVADERVFIIDRPPDAIVARMARRGGQPATPARLVALDARTGGELWSTDENVFGTWLSYSLEHGLLLQAGRPAAGVSAGESGERMIVYRVADGAVVWDRAHRYEGPPLLHGETIITQGDAFGLLDGERRMRRHPLTGAELPWQWERSFGCSAAIGSETLLTFRSGAAGFYDLERDSGTGNFGGFKSGCVANLVVADGVLNAPDYTRHCICSYQNQTSLALVHDPEVELWTWNDLTVGDEPVLQVGVNLGAPGNRTAGNGTLWLEHPITGGPSPDLQITTEPAEPRWFRRHSSTVTGDAPGWIGASGAEGISRLSVRLSGEAAPPRAYTVTLHFVEPHEPAPGQRVFDVTLHGAPVLQGFDLAREAGGTLRTLARSFEGVMIGEYLTVELVAAPDSAPPVLCGVEVVAE